MLARYMDVAGFLFKNRLYSPVFLIPAGSLFTESALFSDYMRLKPNGVAAFFILRTSKIVLNVIY